uniref:Uncharacterized protein n=1 Tax=Anguilla anguilla TaxID=7936 RepID=A0A0E9VUB9_ANGAN
MTNVSCFSGVIILHSEMLSCWAFIVFICQYMYFSAMT